MSARQYLNNFLQALHDEEETGIGSIKRYALFPILDEKKYEFYQKQEIIHWSATELDFTADVKDYVNCPPHMRHVIDIILAFFLSGDGVIADNVVFRFLLECREFEERAMFISQLHIELIHAETYGLAALTFKRDAQQLTSLIETALETECVKRKIKFMERWMESEAPRYQRLVAFACSEGIFFCNLFAVIFWFRSKGMFPNFIFANELIARDESLHRDFGAFLFGQEITAMLQPLIGTASYQTQYDAIHASVLTIIQEAVEVEDLFTEHILSTPLEDLTINKLKLYTRLIADNLLHQLSFPSHYGAKNPFTWLNDISMEQKGNFYEVRIGAYKKKSLAEVLDWKKRVGLGQKTDTTFDHPEEVEF